MIDNTVRFISPVGRSRNMHVASDEPSHIHIARPSRLLRQDDSGSSVELTGELRDLAAMEATVRAAA